MQRAKERVTLTQTKESKRVLAGLMGILFGVFGIHKFVLGYYKQGLIFIGFNFITFFLGTFITATIGFIEGIIYLSKSDEDFIDTYQENEKHWF